MKVTKCEECGFEISVKTDACFNCGEKLTQTKNSGVRGFLKKVALILFAVYMLLSALIEMLR